MDENTTTNLGTGESGKTETVESLGAKTATVAPAEKDKGNSDKYWTLALVAIAIFFALGVMLTAKDITNKYVHPVEEEPLVKTNVVVKESTGSEADDAEMVLDNAEEDMNKPTDEVTSDIMQEIDSIDSAMEEVTEEDLSDLDF